MTIELRTRNGHFVAAFESIAALMSPPPGVMTWGARVFVLTGVHDDPEKPLVYEEDLIWYLIEGFTCNKPVEGG